MVKRNMTSRELFNAIGLSEANLSLLKSGKVKGICFVTLEVIYEYPDCQPGDSLEHCVESKSAKNNPAQVITENWRISS